MDNRDHTEAAALQIAHEFLLKMGWRFSAAEIGKTAREIIMALDKEPGTKNTVGGFSVASKRRRRYSEVVEYGGLQMPGTDKKKAQDRERMKAKRRLEAQIVAAYYSAVETAVYIKENPQGGLWNYGTTPTIREQAIWQGRVEVANEILDALRTGEPNDHLMG